MHVDDGLILVGGDPPDLRKELPLSCPDPRAVELANDVMAFAAGALEKVGFHVGTQEPDGSLGKIIGYELVRHPAQLRLPADRAILLQDSLYFLVSCAYIWVDQLRSVLGTWIWGENGLHAFARLPVYASSFVAWIC